MPERAPYVARKGGTFLFRRRPPVHSAFAGLGLNPRPHVDVALRTRDLREARRRAAAMNAIAEAGCPRATWVLATVRDGITGLEAAEIVHLDGEMAFVRDTFRNGMACLPGGTHRVAPGQSVTVTEAVAWAG